jgi:hypothetical protein
MMAWLGVALMWAAGVAVFIGVSVALLWIGGRLLPLAGRGRLRG